MKGVRSKGVSFRANNIRIKTKKNILSKKELSLFDKNDWLLHTKDIYAIIESMNKRLIIDNNILEIRKKFHNIPEI